MIDVLRLLVRALCVYGIKCYFNSLTVRHSFHLPEKSGWGVGTCLCGRIGVTIDGAGECSVGTGDCTDTCLCMVLLSCGVGLGVAMRVFAMRVSAVRVGGSMSEHDVRVGGVG